MTHKEIKLKKQALNEINARSESGPSKQQDLVRLAKEVGASPIKMYSVGYANDAELTHNIEQALQTETMIDMCKTASRNYIIALIATIIALGSAVALWVAVCK